MTMVYCTLLWIFVSKCDSCSCVRVCKGVCVCVCKVVRVYLQGCACVPVCGSVGVCSD